MEATPGKYSIWTRNQWFERINEVKDFEKLSLDLKWDEMGSFSLRLPLTEYIRKWGLTGATNYSLLTPSGTPNAGGNTLGIIIIRNNSALADNIFSGVITDIDWTGYSPASDKITIVGKDDKYFLSTRVVYPDATHFYDATTHWWCADKTCSHSYINTNIEQAMSGYVYVNLGTGAISWRQLTYFDCATPGSRGNTIEYWGRLEYLDVACKNILKLQADAGFGFAVKQIAETGTPRLTWQFQEPVDKSASVVFGSELGTVKQKTYREARPKFNNCLVGGISWDGAATSSKPEERLFQGEQNAASMTRYGRIEAFQDGAGQDSVAEDLAGFVTDMSNTANSQLADNAFNQSVEIELSPTEMVQFMNDFQLGNIVTVELPAPDGTKLRLVNSIREVKIDVTSDGKEVVTPIVCDPWQFTAPGGTSYELSQKHKKKLDDMARRK